MGDTAIALAVTIGTVLRAHLASSEDAVAVSAADMEPANTVPSRVRPVVAPFSMVCAHLHSITRGSNDPASGRLGPDADLFVSAISAREIAATSAMCLYLSKCTVVASPK